MTESSEVVAAGSSIPVLAPSRRRYLSLRLVAEQIVIVAALPILLPLCAIIAIMVWLDSPGPILFRQPRPGVGHRVFTILKFRTMHAEQCDDGSTSARTADPRVTRLGRWLRLLHLDELPQAWNILRGEMSIIGPRPAPLSQTVMFEEAHPPYRQRRSLRPGVTGWAQVCLGYTEDLNGAQKKLEYDLYYIEHLSLRLDMAILVRSLVVLFTIRGAR
jgi:lipopolysaccharide/colanic/teichoic acid biosynthesis glycosyltransferase